MKTGIDPTVDYAFKQLLGNEGRVSLPIDLLAAVLDLPEHRRPRQIHLLNPFSEATYAGGKTAVLDVKARDEMGRQYHLEMQRKVPWSFEHRVVYYGGKLHAEQMMQGDYYETLQPTHSICFTIENCIPVDGAYHHRFVFHDPEQGVTFSNDVQIHVIELAKFDLEVKQVRTQKERWCYLLKHGAELDPDRLPAELDVPIIRQALEVLVMISQSELERFRQIDREMALRDERSRQRAYEEKDRKLREAEQSIQQIEQKAQQIEQKAQHAEQKAQHAEQKAQSIQAELSKVQQAIREMEANFRLAQLNALISQIHVLQRVQKLPLTPREDLLPSPVEDLTQLIDQLERRLLPPLDGGA